MVRKGLLLFFFFNLFWFSFTSVGLAKSGCCSGHDGVDCSAGAQGNGKVICNDGWRGSSCLYSEMVMCGGSPAKPADPVPTQMRIVPTRVVQPTTKPKPKVTKAISTPKPSRVITRRPTPTKAATLCSDQVDNQCPRRCTAGNDADCCALQSDYQWYDNWGCYPKKPTACSDTSDGICPSHCDNGWDADCCQQNLSGYRWYENWGCYQK